MTSPFSPDRRSLLKSAAGLAAGAILLPHASAETPRDWTGKTPTRYPDPDIVVLDKRFAKYKIGNTPIQRLHTGMLWAEGPAWSGVGKYLLWSDIPNDRQLRWLDEDGHVSTFRKPAGNSNGNTFDFEGRQIAFTLRQSQFRFVVAAISLDPRAHLFCHGQFLAAQPRLNAFAAQAPAISIEAQCIGEFHSGVLVGNRLPILMAGKGADTQTDFLHTGRREKRVRGGKRR